MYIVLHVAIVQTKKIVFKKLNRKNVRFMDNALSKITLAHISVTAII